MFGPGLAGEALARPEDDRQDEQPPRVNVLELLEVESRSVGGGAGF